VFINEIGGQFFMHRKTKRRIYSCHAGLHRLILGGAYVTLDNIWHEATLDGTIPHTVLGWNTDSMKIRRDSEIEFIASKNKKACKPGEFYVENKCHIRGQIVQEIADDFTRRESVRTQWKDAKIDSTDKSMLVCGMPGTGKTWKMCSEIKIKRKKGRKCIARAYTKAACENIHNCDDEISAQTFDSYFHQLQVCQQCNLPWEKPAEKLCECETTKKPTTFSDSEIETFIEKAKGLDYIYIDEPFMAPKRFFFLLFQLKQHYPKLIIRMFGDPWQCKPMETDWVDYMSCPLFQSLVDHNRHEMQYDPKTCRYDKDLRTVLLYLKKHRMLHQLLHKKRLRSDVSMSMCMSGTRTRFIQNELERSKYNTDVGMPVVAFKNMKKPAVMNSHRYNIVSENDEYVTLERNGDQIELTHEQFNGHFRYGFCDSVFRNQGRTLEEPHNLFDVERMFFRDIYTALSRFRTLDDISFACTEFLKRRVFPIKTADHEPCEFFLVPLDLVIDARIYRIYDSSGNMYIGYTRGTLEKRHQEHLEKPTSKITAQ
jgi:hypothetical protein